MENQKRVKGIYWRGFEGEYEGLVVPVCTHPDCEYKATEKGLEPYKYDMNGDIGDCEFCGREVE